MRELGELLVERKRQIADEMASLASVSDLSQGKHRAGGCLRLEEVYCVKRGKRYGPYGPYYYVYFHRTEGMEKHYLGKRVDRFLIESKSMDQLSKLEQEYKQILGLEKFVLQRS